MTCLYCLDMSTYANHLSYKTLYCFKVSTRGTFNFTSLLSAESKTIGTVVSCESDKKKKVYKYDYLSMWFQGSV